MKKEMIVLEKFHCIDLTHELHGEIPTWSGSCGFVKEMKMDYPDGCRVLSYKMHAGVGTHLDAPSHFIPGGRDVEMLAPDELIVPLCVIDVQKKSHSDYLIAKEDIQEYENRYGLIPEKSLVVGLTGWDKFWNVPDKYRNSDASGKKHFPGFSIEAAEHLIEREIAGIGIDTLSPDGTNTGFPVHELILGSSKYIVENLTYLQKLPPKGAFVIIFPLKIQGGAESAVRAVALLPLS